MRVFLALFLCAAALSAADQSRRAPGFALPDSKMHFHDLYDYRGKPVILEFMQTTCPHCAAFVSVLQKIQQKYGDKVVILAVVTYRDTNTTVAEYTAGHHITYPILFDSGQMTYSYTLEQHSDLPVVFLIDTKGMIVSHYEYGPLTRDIFEGNALINEVERLVPAAKK